MIDIRAFTYRGYDLVTFPTRVTLVHAQQNRTILYQANSLDEACLWVDQLIKGTRESLSSDIDQWSATMGLKARESLSDNDLGPRAPVGHRYDD